MEEEKKNGGSPALGSHSAYSTCVFQLQAKVSMELYIHFTFVSEMLKVMNVITAES